MKTITVQGIGRVSAPADTVELSFHISEKNRDYKKALHGASEKVDTLERALAAAGFLARDFQAAGFHVHTEYESVRDAKGEYKNVFAGYVCSYDQSLRFDFDTQRLSDALLAVAESKSQPQMNVSFTVREPERLEHALLKNAAVHARDRAEVLCEASGMQLGELQKIEYDFQHLNFRSNTVMDMEESAPMMAKGKRSVAVNFRPEDISLQDSAVFVWEMHPLRFGSFEANP